MKNGIIMSEIILGWRFRCDSKEFTEGFDTFDMVEAKELLEELATAKEMD